MGTKPNRRTYLATTGAVCFGFLAPPSAAGVAAAPPSKEDYRHHAMIREGEAGRGQAIFFDEQRTACSHCHSVDGKGGKAGPDLFAVGDKFGRGEIIESVLSPSATIAVGYSTTMIGTKSGEEYTGIIKQVTDAWIELMGADARSVRIASGDIQMQHTSEVSLMPDGLEGGLTPEEFTDLIEYLVGLKQPESAAMVEHGMPSVLQPLAKPVALRPFIAEELKFEHPVWFGPVPGESNAFLVVEHETGKVWRLEKGSASASGAESGASSDPSERPTARLSQIPVGGTPTGAGKSPALLSRQKNFDAKTLFADLGAYQKGTRGLLGLALHPRFHNNRRYFVAKHAVENGKFATK